MNRIPVAQGIFTWAGVTPVLIGSRCDDCGEYFFPVQKGCSNCSSSQLSEVELGNEGTLWSWTVQRFPPKEPFTGDRENFKPYGVGYVELPSGLKVESRLLGDDHDAWRIGMRMRLELEAFRRDEEGSEVMTFAFRAADAVEAQ